MPPPRQACYPASANQRRMYVLNQLSPRGTEYNVPVAVRLEGELEFPRLKKALLKLIERHASLRTSFEIVEDEVVQKIRKSAAVPLSRCKATNKEKVEEIRKSFVRPFDLRSAPLLRACLIMTTETEHVLLFDMHHIICDGVSVEILIEELGRLYDGQTLKKPPAEYKDFVVWQNHFASTTEAARQQEYWLGLLDGDRPTLNLPADHPRKSSQSFGGDRVFTRPDKQLGAGLRALAAGNRVSMYMLLLSAYYILLSKYAGQEDLIVGTLVAGRPDEKFRNTVGLFVNTLLLRSRPKGELQFVDYLKQVRGECLNAFENQDCQFEDLVDVIGPPRDLGRNPLFDTMFAALSFEEKIASYRGVRFSRYELDYEISKFDLSLTAIERPNQELALEFEYCADLFCKQSIEKLASHYLNVLGSIVENPSIKLSEINVLTPGERSILASLSLQPPENEKKRRSVVELFEEQVLRNPDAPAVSWQEKTLSYRELDRRSSQLAAKLHKQGIRRGGIVGIAASPSIEAIVGILGALKAGSAYLPIEPATPMTRFRKIVEDSGITVLLICGEAKQFASPELVTIFLDEPLSDFEQGLPAAFHDLDDLAYVIYTSGSTGTPKGVMISHNALSNYILWAAQTYVGAEQISFALHSSLSVDLTVTSIFVPLVSGNQIVIYKNDDPIGLMREVLKDNQVNLIKVTPTHLGLLGEAAKDIHGWPVKLRKIIVGGEDLKTSLATRIHALFSGQIEIFNEYGPTEATVGCTIHKFDPQTDTALSVPIGQAINNTQIFLLDKYGNPVPDRVTGELYIGGTCLAKGYRNNPELTEHRFVTHSIGPVQVRVYRTGDLARRLASGEIEFLGRNDDQVKIRGFRVELGEIEANLLRLKEIKEAVVTARSDAAGDCSLCAYVVLNGEIPIADLRTRLSQDLPAHMVPTWFVPLEALPIGRGGKLDRKALPDPRQFMVSGDSYSAPRSQTETRIAKIWQEVLGLERVGIDDNFFDLGGQSLKATFMIAAINRELGASLSLRDVFAHPVIRDLAVLAGQNAEDKSEVIEPSGGREYYPASSAQKRLYILHQLAPLDVQYNVPWAIQITGTFDQDNWEQAFRNLIARHESLRTSFALIDDEIVQKIHPQVDFTFERTVSNGAGGLQRQIKAFVRPFDLGNAPLLRCAIAETGTAAHAVIVDTHHIISDGISAEIMLDELLALYQGQSLEPPAIQYKDYAAWQRAQSTTPRVQAQGDYWTKLFQGELPVLNLPADFARGAVQSFEGDQLAFQAAPTVVSGLKAINRECGATMHMTLLAAYTILLSKYAGQEDIVVGTPVAGRNHASLQKVVGMFVNTLAMRNQPQGGLTFNEFLGNVKTNALDAYSNQEYQFEELVDQLEIERNLSRNPLFDTVFASLDNASRKFEMEGLSLELLEFDWKISKFDLTLLAVEREERLDFEFEYCTKLFRRSTVERFANHLIHILEQISSDPDRRIEDIELLTQAERQQIMFEFNRTGHEYPGDRSIQDLFEEQAAKNPGNPAVVYEGTSLSYLQLNQRANQLARRLVSAGIASQEIVAIIAGPSLEMIVGVLGILKAGGAYLPIDRDCPEDRVRAMLEDSGVKILITAGGGEWRDDARLVLDLDNSELYQGNDTNLEKVGPRNLAYVIYTSGTTGVPKGALIEHHSVNNLCAWHNDAFKVTAADHATKYARFSFDASVWEIFPYLQAGAALYVVPEEIRLDLERLNHYFDKNRITISFLPTQVCELFTELENNSLRILLTGGDRLRRFKSKNYQVVNNYGPTENTVVATSCEVRAEEERIPIGKPVFNTRIYLLNKENKLVPVGVPGELCISGVGLARAYLNDPRQTSENFVENPCEPGARMYRTGDLARWLPDGSIEFIGRTDKQIKIRGCRTEPREIEATILAHEAVKDAVVVPREDSQHSKFLCGYVAWRNEPKTAELRNYLSSRLPDYMIPAFLLTVENIPINTRGKIALDKLPNPDGSMVPGQTYVSPRNEIEGRLAEIWRRVLERERVGVYDKFFEIGGDSLRATIMLAKANREFAASVALGAVFDNPTVSALAHCFEGVKHDDAIVLKPAKPRLYYSMTPTQSLLYAVCMATKGVEYNLPMAFELRGDLNTARLQQVFRQLVRRHEAFRTSFRMVDGRPVQMITPAIDFDIDFREECGDDDIREVARDFIRPFDLSAAPLLRVALVPMGAGRNVLLMDMHHLVSDGTSMGILFQEMAALYAGQELPLPSATFKDFTEWLDGHLQSKKVRDQEEYWLNVLKDPSPLIKIDTDYPRPEKFSFTGSRIRFEASPELHSGLKALCSRQGATLYMVLLAAYNVLLSKYSGCEDIIVGVPTIGRYIAEVQDVIGMFVSTHAIRSWPDARLRFEDFLEHVKAGVRGALEHQEYQLWSLMLGHAIKTGGKPLFNSVFVVQNQAFTAMEIPGLEIKEIDAGYYVSKFDLTLGAVEKSQTLEFELEYNTDLFKRTTARRFARHYLNLLEQIVADPSRELRDLELAMPAEKEQILHKLSTGSEPATDGNVIHLFEQQAGHSPDRTAVVCNGNSLTYGELNQFANQLARRLQSDGVEPGDIVGIRLESSLEMVIGLLAILKAGAAYLPVSKGFPLKRIQHVLADCRAKLLLGDADAGRLGLETPLVDIGDQQNFSGDNTNLPSLQDAKTLACVEYVADRTGVLKGAMIEHGPLFDRSQRFAHRFSVTPSDRSAKYRDLSTRAAIFELFPFLCSGASVFILPEAVGHSATLLNECLAENGVTIAWLPARLCEYVSLAENKRLRVLITAERNVGAASAGAYEPVRCWGPAENTGITMCCPVSNNVSSGTVGQIFTDSEICIIGHDGGLLPVGISGELCLTGRGLAKGYVNDGALTASRFSPNPYVQGGRMFHTGELARSLPNGQIELTGRPVEVSLDNQRVFLAEIERHLESYPQVQQAAVVFDDHGPARPRLVAFIVLQSSLQSSAHSFVQALKLHLAEWLPVCMVPEAYVKVAMIPQDADGRVQYELLPVPERNDHGGTGMFPADTTSQVTSIVKNLLNVERVGAEDNLLNMGMDSLTAMRLAARLKDTFGVQPAACQAFTTPTVSGISHSVVKALRGKEPVLSGIEQQARMS